MGLSDKKPNQKFVKVVYENGDYKAGAPSFGIMGKIGGKWEVAERGNNLTGFVVGIETDAYQHRNVWQHQVKLKLQSDGENYSLELGYGYYSRNVLNSLAGVGDLSGKEIEFSIYRNKEDYVSIFVKANGEKVDWAVEASKLPKDDDPKWMSSFDYLIEQIKGCLAPADESGASFAPVEAGDPIGATEPAGPTTTPKPVMDLPPENETPPPTSVPEGGIGNELDDLPF